MSSTTSSPDVVKIADSTADEGDPFTYDKEEMLRIAVTHPACLRRPKCLPHEFDTEVGIWSPENWLKSIWRVDSPVNLPPGNSGPMATSSRPKKKVSESESVESETTKKKPTAVDRLKLQAEEDVVLSPQRRSFGAGCHVTGKRNASPREDERPVEPQRPKPLSSNNRERNEPRGGQQGYQRRDYYDRNERGESWNNYGSNQYGSRDNRSEQQPDRRNFDRRGEADHQNDYDNRRGWGSRDNNRRDGGDVRNSAGNNSRGGGRQQNWYRDDYDDNRRGGYHQQQEYQPRVEKEPEWMSDGPTSMLDTIELVGFDDDKNKRSESPTRHSTKSHQPTKTVKEESRRSPVHHGSHVSVKGEETEVVPTDPTIPATSETFPDFDIKQFMHTTLYGMDSPILANITQSPKAQAEAAGSSRFSKFFQSETEKDDQNNNAKMREQFRTAAVQEHGGSDILKMFGTTPRSTATPTDKLFEARATNVSDLEQSFKGSAVSKGGSHVGETEANRKAPGLLQDLFKSAGTSESRVSMPSLPNPPINAMTEEQLLATLMKDKKPQQMSDVHHRPTETVGKAIDADSLFFLKQQEQLRQIISHHQQQPSQSSAPHQQPGGRPPSVQSGVNPMLLEAMQKLQMQQQQQLSGYPTNVMQHQAMMDQLAQQSNRGRVPSPISEFNQHLAALQHAAQHSQVNQIQLASQQNALLQALAAGKISHQDLMPHMQNIYQRAMMSKKPAEQSGANSGQPQAAKNPAMTAFTPTSVLKQLHSASKPPEGTSNELKVDVNSQRSMGKPGDPSRSQVRGPPALSPGGSGQPLNPVEWAKMMESQKNLLMMAGGNPNELMKQQHMFASASAMAASRLPPPPPMPYNMAALNNSMPMAIRAQQAAAAMMVAQQRAAGIVDPRQRAALQQQLSYIQQQQQAMNQAAAARNRTPQPGSISATNLPPALLEMLQLQAARSNQQTAAALGIRSSTSPQNFPFGLGPPGGISLPQQQSSAQISPQQMAGAESTGVSNVLNKWFSDEVLRQQHQHHPGLNGQDSSTALTLEDLEKLHRSQKPTAPGGGDAS